MSDADAGPDSHWRLVNPLFPFWGSGGLSFHRKSAALQCLAARGPPLVPTNYPEDTFFAECVTLGHGTPPPNTSVLAAFCTQDYFGAQSFGAHQARTRLEHMNAPLDFLVFCPETVPLLQPGPVHDLSSFDADELFWGVWRQARFPP